MDPMQCVYNQIEGVTRDLLYLARFINQASRTASELHNQIASMRERERLLMRQHRVLYARLQEMIEANEFEQEEVESDNDVDADTDADT